ncbi:MULTISPECIES: FtsK/SpoIIIE domain-containing protein [unclassified Streptomyces]|uniref:FtsK/SpoIIIE domain-containing protein n=1 Tax=unclassified Streptomyces TaxID=2593676 RepID=UPI000DB9B4EB|nr:MULTISPECIES: FtsK/SpoIIIE domain-containing protein [unclassified Streptomyces]MYT70310.1 plasmid transfer protein [Streptomyces sp. SID8367]RAJ88887.1 S-DNA-T family DNA segregation ATPase FtsK/SpoIIIE [Streptomyces sp. PsTaAH-137]
MADPILWVEAAGALAGAGGIGYAKVRAPRVYWTLVGLPVTRARFAISYRTTMDVCGLTVRPSGLRAFMARNIARGEVLPVPPKVRRVRITSTGLRVTLRLPAGLEPFDIAAASERLRHAWGVHAVNLTATKPGFVELRMTGYDVLSRVRMPRKVQPHDLVVPVALRDDGTVFERDYRQVPQALTLGATLSGKSVYQRNLIKGLAQLPVALVGIDCKRGVEQARYAARLSALATNPDDAASLIDVLVAEMEDRFDLLAKHGASDLWALPEYLRSAPIVVLVDEIAELFLISSKTDEARRERIVTGLIRLAQLSRSVGIYLEICGQRFGSELGKGATMLRAQLTGRVVHRVNDKQTAEMGLSDVAPDAVPTASLLPADRPGQAVAADSSGGWSRIRTPHTSEAETVAVCAATVHLIPDLPALEPFRPAVPLDPTLIIPPMPTQAPAIP